MTKNAGVQCAVIGDGQVVVERTAGEQEREEVCGRPKKRVNGEVEGNVVDNGGIITDKALEGNSGARHRGHGDWRRKGGQG